MCNQHLGSLTASPPPPREGTKGSGGKRTARRGRKKPLEMQPSFFFPCGPISCPSGRFLSFLLLLVFGEHDIAHVLLGQIIRQVHGAPCAQDQPGRQKHCLTAKVQAGGGSTSPPSSLVSTSCLLHSSGPADQPPLAAGKVRDHICITLIL